MYICDTHVHSIYSFDSEKDGSSELDIICETAISRGINEIVFTDHYDIDGIIEGYYDPYDNKTARAAVLAANEKYAPRLRVTYGIELGQPAEYPEEAARFLRENNFEFVLGSLHNIRGCLDFCYIQFKKMSQRLIEHVTGRYLDECLEMLDFPGISAIAHLTYVQRYVTRAGGTVDFLPFHDRFTAIFKKMIDRGVALEVNTSSFYKNLGFFMPDAPILKLYRECGGELVTVGSDAHWADNIGRGLREAYAMLREVGFEYVTIFRGGKPEMIKIEC